MKSERDRIRTYDRLLRRQMLYPAELRTHCGKKKFPKELLKVGAAGFEPATSWSQTRRDDRTTLRPENFVQRLRRVWDSNPRDPCGSTV